MDKDPGVQRAYMMHVEEHHAAKAQKEQMQAMQDMAMGVAPQPQGSANDPTQTKSQGKGAPNTAREAAALSDVPPGEKPV